MTSPKSMICFVLAFGLAVAPGQADKLELKYERLNPAIDLLNSSDRNVVRDAISLLKRGDHLLALSRLAAIKEQNPDNSSLRILASYALLQAGNLPGAFEEAEAAHKAPNGSSYKCWFLAKVSLLAGKKDSCRRELEHVKKAGDMVAEVRQLEKELEKN